MDSLRAKIEQNEGNLSNLRREMVQFWDKKDKEQVNPTQTAQSLFSFFTPPKEEKKKSDSGIKMRSLKEYEDYEKMVQQHANHFKDIKNLYLYGSPGSGKTFMMDLFYDNLSIKKKKRVHFAEFMLKVHDDLHHLRQKVYF